jgi:hypothetical protein
MWRFVVAAAAWTEKSSPARRRRMNRRLLFPNNPEGKRQKRQCGIRKGKLHPAPDIIFYFLSLYLSS